jgi:cytochrome P450
VTATTDQVRIEDPAFYLGDPYPVYARLREDDPVHLREDLRIWLLTKYADVVDVSKQPVRYSVKRGFLLNDALTAQSTADQYFVGAELIATVDPPRHNELRRVISPAFTPKRVARLEDSVRSTARELVAALPAGRAVDYICVVAEVLPLVVIARLLGVTGDNIDDMARWSDELMKIGQQLTDVERAASVEVFSQMNDFMRAQFAHKREQPAEDLLSTLLTAELDNAKLSEDNILMWASVVLAGGNETTRALLGNMVDALARHPEQLAAIAADATLADAAVEETLRWNGPVYGFCRLVTADTELHGKQLKRDDWVYLLYASANRDADVFADPEHFDITAPRAKENLGFGVGQHFCPGNQLARLEARVLLEELVARFPRWDIDGAGTRIESTFRSGFLELPVVLHET